MATERFDTREMSREQWLDERKKSLGGSDIGAILGLNAYSSPYTVWADKTGRLPEIEDNEAMRQGRDLEDYVARRFAEVSGKNVRRENSILRNSEYPHIHANVDRLIIGEKSGLECKTASALNTGKFANGEFPTSYYAQCVTYLAVTGYERWYLAVLILGREFKVYQMTRIENDTCPSWCEASLYVGDDEFRSLRNAALAFWQHVEQDEAPIVDGTESTLNTIKQLYSESSLDDEEVDLTPLCSKLEELMSLRDQISALETRENELKASVQDYMKEAPKGKYKGITVSWKSQTRNTFDAKRFAKEHPEMDLSAYYNLSTVRPFKLTMKKEK